MIGGISKKLLSKIVSWGTCVLSLLGFIWLSFPANQYDKVLNEYRLMQNGLNPYNAEGASTRVRAVLNLVTIIILVISIVITMLANSIYPKLIYGQTACYILIAVLAFLHLIFPERHLAYPLTMGIIFTLMAAPNVYFNILFYKGKLTDPNED